MSDFASSLTWFGDCLVHARRDAMSDVASSLTWFGDCKTYFEAFCTAVLILFEETCRVIGMGNTFLVRSRALRQYGRGWRWESE